MHLERTASHFSPDMNVDLIQTNVKIVGEPLRYSDDVFSDGWCL